MVQDSIIMVRSGKAVVRNGKFVVGSDKYIWYEIVINNMVRKVIVRSDCKQEFVTARSMIGRGVPNV